MKEKSKIKHPPKKAEEIEKHKVEAAIEEKVEQVECEQEVSKLEDKEQIEEVVDWRDSVYGKINIPIKTLDLAIVVMIGIIVAVLLYGFIKNVM